MYTYIYIYMCVCVCVCAIRQDKTQGQYLRGV